MIVVLKLLFALAAVSLAGLFTLASLAVGLECIRCSRLAGSLDIVAKLGLAFATGHVLLGILMQLCAVFGLFNLTLVTCLFAVSIGAGSRSFRELAGEFRTRHATYSLRSVLHEARERDRIHTLTVGATAICVVAGILPLFVIFFGPPAVDALAYYLAQAKLIAFTGEMTALNGYEAFQVLSYAAEMPFAAMYVLGGETVGHFAAKATIVPVMLASLALMWAIAGACGIQRLGQWLVCLLIMTSSAYLLVAFDGKSDLISNLYAVGSLLALLLASGPNKLSSATLFGLLAGGALLAKFSLFVVLPPAFAVVFAWKFWGNWGDAAKYALVAAAILNIVLVSGWMLKNVVLFSDPVAPFYRFHASTPEFPTEQVWYSAEFTAWIRATYPFALTFGRYPMQYGQVSIGWLLLLPCVITLRYAKNKTSLVLFAAGSLGIAFWVLFRPSILAPRYILPAISMVMFVFAHATETAFMKPRWRLFPLLGIGTLCLTALLVDTASVYRIKLAVSYYASYVSDRPWLPALHRAQAMSRLPLGERVLFLSYQNEYLRGDLLNSFLPSRAVSAAAADKEAFWRFINDHGVNYVVVDKTHPLGQVVDMTSAPPEFSVTEHEFLANLYYLYEIKRME